MNFKERPSAETRKDSPVTNLSEGIETAVIRDLAFDMFKLARGLKERALTYDTIVSDDASGRLVSLFIKKVFDGLRKKQNQPPIKTNFIASGRFISENKLNAINNFLDKNKNNLGKVLLVTEYIETGNSIAKIIETLNSLQIDFDLAALTVYHQINRDTLRKRGLKGDFFFASESRSYSSGGVKLHGQKGLSGITKNIEDSNPFPERFKTTIKSEYPEDNKVVQQERQIVQQAVNRARKDIDLLAKKTIELLEK